MMKRIMSILLTISFAAGIAGCTTIGETTQTTQPTIISGQVTTTVPATTIAVSVETTVAQEKTLPTEADEVSNVGQDTEVLETIEPTVFTTLPVTTEQTAETPSLKVVDDVYATTLPTSVTSTTVPTIVAPTSNNWGIVSTSTDIETSTGNVSVERGSYILIITESESFYTISWYNSTAEIPKNCVRNLGYVTPDEEKIFLQRRTAGVVYP